MYTFTSLAGSLFVCIGSADLFGPLTDDAAGSPTHEQRCGWRDCPHRDEPWHRPQTDLPEPSGDFPTEVELCYCCAAAVIPSGSKFSSFYCDACRAGVRRLRDELGYVSIPLGRHSLMNGVGLSAREVREPPRVDAFATALNQMTSGIERLSAWQRIIVADHAAAMNVGMPYVSLPPYLAFVREHGAPKRTMLRQLSRYFDGRELLV